MAGQSKISSQGIEVLVKKAAVDPEFKTLLLERRAAAAESIGLELDLAEIALLGSIPVDQLEAIIARTEVPEESRRAFLGMAAAAMLAALGIGATGCGSFFKTKGNAPDRQQMPCEGIRPDPDYPYGVTRGMDIIRTVYDIHFDTDEADLRPDQLEYLEKDLAFFKDHLKNNPDVTILVEGHCDEHGTEEYNYALGERRAQAVKDYFVRGGIDEGRMVINSKGKSAPLDPRHIEAAWAKNRRVRFLKMY